MVCHVVYCGYGYWLNVLGVAEPVMHYVNPPSGEPQTIEAAQQALRVTFFHWGLHAWAIYAVVGLALAYFAYRHNLPLKTRSALYPLIGKRFMDPGATASIYLRPLVRYLV